MSTEFPREQELQRHTIALYKIIEPHLAPIAEEIINSPMEINHMVADLSNRIAICMGMRFRAAIQKRRLKLLALKQTKFRKLKVGDCFCHTKGVSTIFRKTGDGQYVPAKEPLDKTGKGIFIGEEGTVYKVQGNLAEIAKAGLLNVE